jgi:predicted kinase
MSGAPGSGKSTLAKNLARSMNGIVISHDLIKSFFLEDDIPFEKSARLTYDFQWTLAKDFIEQGQTTVIVDSPCNYQQILDQGESLARKYNYVYRYIECRVDSLDLLEVRLQSRAPMRSQRATIASSPVDAIEARHSVDYQTIFKRWIDHPFRPASNAILVNSSTSSPEECLAYALHQLIPLSPDD